MWALYTDLTKHDSAENKIPWHVYALPRPVTTCARAVLVMWRITRDMTAPWESLTSGATNKDSFTKRVAINSAQLPTSHSGIIFSCVCVCVITRTCADMMHKSQTRILASVMYPVKWINKFVWKVTATDSQLHVKAASLADSLSAVWTSQCMIKRESAHKHTSAHVRYLLLDRGAFWLADGCLHIHERKAMCGLVNADWRACWLRVDMA